MVEDKEQIYILDAKKFPVRIGLVVIMLFALLFGWFAIRWQIGNLLADITSPNQENAKQSAMMAYGFAPDDPLTLWLVASVEKESNPEYTEGFEKVVRYSPNDYRWWIQLGRAYEQADKPKEAEKAFKRSVETAPNYTFPHWQIGNFYLRQDRDDEAFKEFEIAARNNPVYREQIFSIAWDYYEQDTDKLESIVGNSAEVRAGLAKFYAAKERPNESLEMWNSLTAEAKQTNDQTARLIAQALYDKKFLLSSVEFVNQTGIEENAKAETIYNGGFEEKINDSADKVFFGWKILPAEKLSIRQSQFKKHEDKKSLHLSFTGFNKVEINNIYQSIAVRPKAKYQLSFWVKTENLKSAGTPKIDIVSVTDNQIIESSEAFPDGTNDWKEFKVSFTVPENSEGITLRTARSYCGENCPIVGSMWYDSFKLVKISGE